MFSIVALYVISCGITSFACYKVAKYHNAPHPVYWAVAGFVGNIVALSTLLKSRRNKKPGTKEGVL